MIFAVHASGHFPTLLLYNLHMRMSNRTGAAVARFYHRFRVTAPLSAVWNLHDDPSILKHLTPPPLQVKILHMDSLLKAESQLRFRLGFGPLGAVWHAIYDEFTPYQPGLCQCGFVDRSLSSPFYFWTHRHTFDDAGDGTSTITDDVRFELLPGVVGKLITWVIAYPAIAFLFFFRRLTTRRLLGKQVNRTVTPA